MWEVLAKLAPVPVTSAPTKPPVVVEGAQSVKNLAFTPEKVKEILSQHLQQFAFTPLQNDSLPTNPKIREIEEENGTTVGSKVHVFIFLPPKYHLLMRFNLEAKQTIVEIQTDYWRTLTFVDQYFDQICK